MGALRRAVWDKIGASSPEDVLAAIETHKESLEAILTKEHIGNLQHAQRAKQMLDRVRKPRGTPENLDATAFFEDITGQGLMPWLGKQRAMATGRMQPYYYFTESGIMFLRGISNKSLNRAYEEALYSSDLAKTLADMASTQIKIARPAAKKFNAWMYGVAAESARSDPRGGANPGRNPLTDRFK